MAGNMLVLDVLEDLEVEGVGRRSGHLAETRQARRDRFACGVSELWNGPFMSMMDGGQERQ